ncbi:hypothetical protein FTW19_08215 [Terriglobus albidus]|uniref:Uncharacterized protein n=1 Tax=Terriglobus albidus TaxID=1592106 RepID=A0A5B9EBZ3_9BACT|nr:hypothetical protein [Terriglobus albidus]QEE27981.1 hypothetical protein FTW19_08215 [Terriglobus albidus]
MHPWIYPVRSGSENHFALQTLPEFFSESSDYIIVAQDAIEVQDIRNAPAFSMGAFLAMVDEANIFPTISVYTREGYNRKHARLLYMNAAALRVWKAMGKHPREIGTQHRPPNSAVLAFGTPFGA